MCEDSACSTWLKCFTLQVLLRLMMVCDSWVFDTEGVVRGVESFNTLRKISMETKDRGLDDDFPFQRGDFSGSM